MIGILAAAIASGSLSINVAPGMFVPFSGGNPSYSVLSSASLRMPVAEKTAALLEGGLALTQAGTLLPRASLGLNFGLSREVGLTTLVAYGTNWSLTSQSIGLIVSPSYKFTDNIRGSLGIGPMAIFAGGQTTIGFSVSPRLTVSF